MTRQTAAAREKADHFGESGAPDELLVKRDLSAPAVVGKAHRVLTRKAGR